MSGSKGFLSEQVGKTIEYLPQCILRTFKRENQLFWVNFDSRQREIEYHSTVNIYVFFFGLYNLYTLCAIFSPCLGNISIFIN